MQRNVIMQATLSTTEGYRFDIWARCVQVLEIETQRVGDCDVQQSEENDLYICEDQPLYIELNEPQGEILCSEECESMPEDFALFLPDWERLFLDKAEETQYWPTKSKS